MAIAYNAGTKVITVTGYTEGTPCTSADIYAADQGGGWGVVTEHEANRSYEYNCQVVLGDGSTETWFADEGVMLLFDDMGRNNYQDACFKVTANATLRLGAVLDAGDYSAKSGCALWDTDTYSAAALISSTGGDIRFYGCSFFSVNRRYVWMASGAGDFVAWHCMSSGYVEWNGSGNGTHEIRQLSIFEDAPNNQGIRGWNGTLEGITLAGWASAVSHTAGAGAVTMNDITVRGSQDAAILMDSASGDLTLRNSDFDAWTLRAAGTGFNGHSIYRQYSVDIHVADADGANLESVTVLCEDKDDNEIFSVATGADGTIAQQWVNYIRYDGTDSSNTYSPHKFTFMFPSGSEMVFEDVTVDGAIDWHIEEPDWPAVADVESGVTYADDSLTGTFIGPETAITGSVQGETITGTVEAGALSGEVS